MSWVWLGVLTYQGVIENLVTNKAAPTTGRGGPPHVTRLNKKKKAGQKGRSPLDPQ